MGEKIVVSLHPLIQGDVFFWERGAWDTNFKQLLEKAKAVILPQTVSSELYHLCQSICPAVFPNYDIRFKWEGKVGDTLFFWAFDVPHPRTLVFPRVEALIGNHPEMGLKPKLPPYPFVLKGAKGGEGSQTWLINKDEDLEAVLSLLKKMEWQGQYGFVVQEYLGNLERDLRVVVIGEHIESYWRINPSAFHKNVAHGARIDYSSDPHLKIKGEEAVKKLCKQTGINLAGFDLVFSDGSNQPLFMEINYTFGRAGLGGSDTFYKILKKEVANWLNSIE